MTAAQSHPFVIRPNETVSKCSTILVAQDACLFVYAPTPPLFSVSVPVIYHDFSLEVFLSEDTAAVPWEPTAASEEPLEMGLHQLTLRAMGRVKKHHLRVGYEGKYSRYLCTFDRLRCHACGILPQYLVDRPSHTSVSRVPQLGCPAKCTCLWLPQDLLYRVGDNRDLLDAHTWYTHTHLVAAGLCQEGHPSRAYLLCMVVVGLCQEGTQAEPTCCAWLSLDCFRSLACVLPLECVRRATNKDCSHS